MSSKAGAAIPKMLTRQFRIAENMSYKYEREKVNMNRLAQKLVFHSVRVCHGFEKPTGKCHGLI
jgi:hypothetical protein